MYTLTRDLSDAFFANGAAAAGRLRARWLGILGVMYVESGVRASQPNLGGSGAVGLIQFMPDTLRKLGWGEGLDAFGRLFAEEQLAWVERYFAPYRGKLDTLAGVYTAVWMPADIGRRRERAFVLSARGGRRGWAYEANASLDANGDLQITVGELEDAVRRGCTGPRWSEVAWRGGGVVPDLRTVIGVQLALSWLGYDAGDVDGVPGPRTRAAVAAFQSDEALRVDGIPGPLTRAALLRRPRQPPKGALPA